MLEAMAAGVPGHRRHRGRCPKSSAMRAALVDPYDIAVAIRTALDRSRRRRRGWARSLAEAGEMPHAGLHYGALSRRGSMRYILRLLAEAAAGQRASSQTYQPEHRDRRRIDVDAAHQTRQTELYDWRALMVISAIAAGFWRVRDARRQAARASGRVRSAGPSKS